MNESPYQSSRRVFLGQTARAGAVGLAFPTIIPGSALGLSGRPAPSNRINLAVIGTGNQGFNDIKSFLRDDRVQLVAVCDANRESAGYWDGKIGGREPARRLVNEHYAKKASAEAYRACDASADFREILGRDDIDAVEICTPDHWHAIMVVDACKAKKDIYCQKPLSLTVADGRVMSENGVTMVVSNKEKMGVTFEGTKGKIYVDRGKLEADPKSLLGSRIGTAETHLYKSDDHLRNFIDCVISRWPTAAPVEVAHRSITICHLGNIAMRLNRDKLRWDPRTEQIVGDDEAAKMLGRPSRAPWALAAV